MRGQGDRRAQAVTLQKYTHALLKQGRPAACSDQSRRRAGVTAERTRGGPADLGRCGSLSVGRMHALSHGLLARRCHNHRYSRPQHDAAATSKSHSSCRHWPPLLLLPLPVLLRRGLALACNAKLAARSRAPSSHKSSALVVVVAGCTSTTTTVHGRGCWSVVVWFDWRLPHKIKRERGYNKMAAEQQTPGRELAIRKLLKWANSGRRCVPSMSCWFCFSSLPLEALHSP